LGGIGFEVPYRVTRAEGSDPATLLADVWPRVLVQLDNILSELPIYGEVLAQNYIGLQSHNRTASEGKLCFDFSDSAGLCHASMVAYDHWARRALWIIIDFQNDDIEAAHGCKLVLPDGLVDEGECLFLHDGRLFVAQRDGEGVRLMGDGSDLEGDELDPQVREAVQEVLTTGVCPCAMCVMMQRNFGLWGAKPEEEAPVPAEAETTPRTWWQRLFGR
jgi:hypothetical protein